MNQEEEIRQLKEKIDLISLALFLIADGSIKNGRCQYCSGEWAGYRDSQWFEHTKACPIGTINELAKIAQTSKEEE